MDEVEKQMEDLAMESKADPPQDAPTEEEEEEEQKDESTCPSTNDPPSTEDADEASKPDPEEATEAIDVKSEVVEETETSEANDEVEDSTKEKEAKDIQENDAKSDPVEVKEVEAASAEEKEVKKDVDASPVESNDAEKDEQKAEDAPTEAKEEKQVEEIIEHPTEAPHPQAPKSSVLEPTSVLDTRDAQDSQERSKEFLELRSYEAKRRSIYLSKMKSTSLYWKAFREMMSKSYEETDRAENLIRGNVVANEAYGNFLKCAAENRLGYDGRTIDNVRTIDKRRGERLQEDRAKKYEELGSGAMLLGVSVNLDRIESQRKEETANSNTSNIQYDLAGSTVANHGSLGKNSMIHELVNSQMEMADAFIENVNFVKDNSLKKMTELRKELEAEVKVLSALGDATMNELEKAELDVHKTWSK